MKLLIVLLAVLSIFYFSFLNWRRAVKAALVILVVEGALRKWVLPQASDLIYFLKDLVLLGAYLKYYSSSEPKYTFRINGVTWPMLMAFGWCLFQAFNPSLGSPIAGFLGLKFYFFYVPLIWMLPTLFQSEEELYKFLRHYLLLVIPVALLTIAQFVSPASSPINMYTGEQETSPVTFGKIGAVRVTGTFSYIGGYATYLTACFSLLIPLLSIQQTLIWRSLTLVEVFLVAGTSFMTGTRGLLLFEIFFVVGYVFALSITNPVIAIHLSKKFILPIIMLLALIPKFFGSAIDAFIDRFNTSSPETLDNRALSPLAEPFQAVRFKGLDGYGTGATHPAMWGLRHALNLPIGERPPPWEVEMGKIVLDIGPIGFVFWYWMRLALIFSLWQVFLRLRKPFLSQLALAAFLFHAINITAGFIVLNHTFSVYYWFFSGFIFLLPLLERKEFSNSRKQLQQQNV